MLSPPVQFCTSFSPSTMQQTDVPTAALIAATSAEGGTRGASSREEDSLRAYTPAPSVPSLDDVKSYNSATTAVYVRRDGAAAGVPLAPDNAAAASNALVTRCSRTTASTCNSGAEGPNAASEKTETVAQASTANTAFGKTFSSTESKKGTAVDPDALSCPSEVLSPDAPTTTTQPHDLVCRATTVVVGTPDTSSGENSPAGTSSSIIPADNLSTDSKSGVEGPTRVTASPRIGTAITTANVASYVPTKLTAGDTRQIHVAANAQKKIQSPAPISSHDAADAMTNVADACNGKIAGLSSFSLTHDNPVMPKHGGAAEERETMNSLATITQVITRMSEISQHKSPTCGAAQNSLASPLKKYPRGTFLALLDPTDSGALLLPPSGARGRLSAFPSAHLDLESLLPSLQCQSYAPSATTVELPDEQEAVSSSHSAHRILEAPPLKCTALSWHTSALPTEKCEITRSGSCGDKSEACQETPLEGADSVCRHIAAGAGDTTTVENEVMPCAESSRSEPTSHSPLEPSVSAAGAQEKEEQPLRPIPTTTAETPSTVTSSSSSGSAPASCSPASSSPSVATATFLHSGLTAASDPSPAAQNCCAKERSSCPAPRCGDLFTYSAYKAPSSTGLCATSPLRCSGLSSVSLPPAAVSSLQYAHLPPGSPVQRADAVPTLKAGVATSDNVVAETNSEEARPAGTRPPYASAPRRLSLKRFPGFVTESTLCPTRASGTSIPRGSPLRTMSEDSQQPLTAASWTEFAVSEQTHQSALVLEAPVPAISAAVAAPSEARDTGARHKNVEHPTKESAVNIQERDGTNAPHKQSFTTTSSTSCSPHRSPLSPAARFAADWPRESALIHSLVADIPRRIGRPFCNTALKVGLPGAALGSVTEGAVRSETPATVGRRDALLTVSPADAGGDKRVHPPGNYVAAQRGMAVAGSGSKDSSVLGSQRCVSRNFLAAGGSNEIRGLTGANGDDSNASTLQVRCLLASSLRSIFKMLIKRVRRQHHHVTGGHSKATLTDVGEDVTGNNLREAKRRRINESVCEAAEVPSGSCVSDGRRPSPETATSGAFSEMGIVRGSAGEKTSAPIRGRNGLNGEHSSTYSPRQNWTPAEDLHGRAASQMNVLTSLSETPRQGVQGRLQNLKKQTAAWTAADSIRPEKTAPEEAEQDAATAQSVLLFPAACSSSANSCSSRAHVGLRQARSELDADATSRAGRDEVAASSEGTLLESGPSPVGRLPPILRKAPLSTVPQASAAISVVLGSQRDVAYVVDRDGNCRSPSYRTGMLEGRGCSCVSRVRCSTENPCSTLAVVPRTKMIQKLPALDTPTINKRCPSPPIFAATGGPVRGLCYPRPYRLEMRERGYSRGSRMATLQHAAALAEQQLLSAYRECFLLLTAAERKEELYIFEFVLLGGSCQSEAALPSERKSASGLNNQRRGGGERQQQDSQQPYALLQAADHGEEILHTDIAANVPSEEARLGRRSSGRGFAAENACTQKGELGSPEDGFLGKAAREDGGERGSGRNAKPERLPACKQEEAEATRKRRRQIALQPEKWDAKKIHYVLAALDGLRDAWRQGSSNTRAKAQILESMFTPAPLGMQQRVLQLTQRQHMGALTHHEQPQKFPRQPPLEKYSDFQQMLASNTSTATQNAGKPATCKKAPPSSPQEIETSEFSSSEGRSVLVSPVARPPISVQSKLSPSACPRDAAVYVKGSVSEIDCGERCVRACCRGNQHWHHISTYCRKISCSSSHRSLSACCTSHMRDRRGCGYRRKEASSCDDDSGCQEDKRPGLTTHRPCEPKGRRATTAVSNCGVRFPTTADTQPPEKSCDISHLESRCQQTARQQHGHYRLRQSNVLANDKSDTIVNSKGLPEEGRRCSLDCSGDGSLHQDTLERAKLAGTGCNGSAESLETSPAGCSRGVCPAPARNFRELRRGKFKSSPAGSFLGDGDKDVYKKPRPSVVSRRVLLQRQLQRQHRRSISHATATSDSDVDITADTAPATHYKKKCTIPAVTRPLETSLAGKTEMVDGGRFSPSGKERELPESRRHKLASEAAARRELGTAKVDEGDDFARLGVDGKCNRDNPALESGSSQQTRLTETFSSKVCHQGGVNLASERQREELQASSQNAKSTSAAAPSVVTGDSLTHAKSRSRSFLLSAPHLRTAQEFPKNAGNKSIANSATQDDSDLGVKTQRALPSLTRTTPTSRALTVSLEELQGEFIVSSAQHSTNLSGEGTRHSDRRSEEGFTNQAAKGMPRAEGSTNQDSQQQTAAMRTTRHNKTKQPGVFQFTRGPKRFWAASWYADGHPGWKAFSVEKWGNREAFERARRAYEEKVPRKCSGSCAAANNLPEVVVSSVRLPCRPASPQAHPSLAHEALDRAAPSANNCTRSGIPNGGKNRISNVGGARPSSSTVSKAKKLTPLNILTLSAEPRPFEKCPVRLPVADASSVQRESPDLVESRVFARDSLCWTTRQEEEEKQCLGRIRGNSQKSRLTSEEKDGLSVVLSAQAASFGTGTPYNLDEGKATLDGSSHRATSPSESIASAQSKVIWTQKAQDANCINGHSSNLCPSERNPSFEAGTNPTMSYQGDPEQPKSFAEGSNLDLAHGGSVREFWSSCSKGAGVLPLEATFTNKEVSPSVYDSSSSTGFELIAPTFSGSPRSLSERQRPLGRQRQEQLRQGLEHLLLSSAPAVNERGDECSETEIERHRQAVERHVLSQAQQIHHSDSQGLPDTGLTAEAYALLSPTAFLPITPENEDVTAQLLLVSPEDEMMKAEGKNV